MYQETNPFTATPSTLGMAGPVVICLLIWGGLLFLAAYIAALAVALVSVVGWWAFRRIRLVLRLRQLAALRQAARPTRLVLTSPRLA